MRRHRAFIILSVLTVVGSIVLYQLTHAWPGWEYIYTMVSKGDNMPIAGLMPLIVFFTYLSLSEAFRHDRLIRQGREDEILDEMYR